MNAKIRYIVLGVLVGAILAALALTTASPLLYSLETDTFPSLFHKNVDVLKQQSLNTTTDVVPDLQDFIDFTGPLSLNIQIHDVEQARRDLERFQKSHGSIKNLIVKLDMNESAIQELEQNTALQQEILDSLLNTTLSLDELQVMEIQYHSENNQDMLTTIRLRGEELRKKVKGMGARYHNATEKVTSSGTKLGLNMTKNQESERNVEQILAEIEQPKEAPRIAVNTELPPGEERISLFVHPDTGRYRDVIEYMGISLTLQGNTTVRAASRQIVLYMDDAPAATVMTDSFGFYDIRIPIERTLAGVHTVYARSPTSRSVNRTLTVVQVDSKTNLTVEKTEKYGLVNCSGFIMANNPVRSAPLQIVWDDTHIMVIRTDAKGWFTKEIQLPPGRHTVIARFSGEGYPIDPSESAMQVIEIPLAPESGEGLNLWHVLFAIVAIVVFIGFIWAAAYYLRRTRRKIVAGAGIPRAAGSDNIMAPGEGGAPGQPGAVSEASEIFDEENETLIAYYARLLEEKGLAAASWRVYLQLAARVARDQNIRRHRSLTAREIARTCRGKAYCRPFASLIAVYERIRYGGTTAEKDQAVFETALHATDEQMEGEHH